MSSRTPEELLRLVHDSGPMAGVTWCGDDRLLAAAADVEELRRDLELGTAKAVAWKADRDSYLAKWRALSGWGRRVQEAWTDGKGVGMTDLVANPAALAPEEGEGRE